MLWLAIIFSAALAIFRWGYELNRLVFAVDGAIDLRLRFQELQQWFQGIPVYTREGTAVYPPATFAMLRPLVSFDSFALTRSLWSVLLVAMTAWLIWLAVEGSKSNARNERLALTLFVMAMYPTAVNIGNGQLALLVIPPLVMAVLLVRAPGRGWGKDLCISMLLVFSLLKPNISVPFIWIVLFSGHAWRIIALMVLTYGSLTLWAAAFQPDDLYTLVGQWLEKSAFSTAGGETELLPSGLASTGLLGDESAQWLQSLVEGANNAGYGSVANLLSVLGIAHWTQPIILLILAALGVWVYRHRHADPWLLLGVCAIVARVAIYHRLYDDLLILIPFVALVRIFRQAAEEAHARLFAGALLLFSWLALLAPGTLLRLPYPYGLPFQTAQFLLWMGMLVLLLRQAARWRSC